MRGIKETDLVIQRTFYMKSQVVFLLLLALGRTSNDYYNITNGSVSVKNGYITFGSPIEAKDLIEEIINEQRNTDLSLCNSSFKTSEDQKGLLEKVSRMTQLEKLIFQNFKDIKDAGSYIKPLANLKTLEMICNGPGLTALPIEIENMKSLQVLVANNNEINVFQKEFENLVSLKKLDLAKNSFQIFPETALKLPKLAELNLSNNWIASWPAHIPKNNTLQNLNLNHNNLGILHPEIANLAGLQVLNLCSTKLTAFPKELVEYPSASNPSDSGVETDGHPFKNLKILDLSANGITSLPKEIGNLTSLEKLDLSNNSIGSLPKETGNLKNLKDLNLSNTGITSLPNSILLIPKKISILIFLEIL